MKTIICSDTHIGYENTNYDKLNEFFEIVNSEAATLVLAGDIFDCWRMPWAQIKSEHATEVRALERLSYKIDIEYVLGNHDYMMKQTRFPCINFHRRLFEFDCYHVEHGDRFDIMQRRFGTLMNLIIQLYPPWYQLFLKSPSEVPAIEDLVSVLPMHFEAARYSKMIGKTMIIGHSHHPQTFENVLDCGDFIDSCSYVCIEDGTHTIERV